MSTVVLASTEADAAAVTAAEDHHATLVGSLTLQVQALVEAASRADAGAAETARAALVSWCEQELLPHAVAEESTLYAAAGATAEGRLVVDGLLGDHTVLTGLVRDLAAASDPVRAAATAHALQTVFDGLVTKETELVLPLLASDPDVSLADLVADLHAALPEQPAVEAEDSGCGGHSCSCGEVDGPELPELDARAVPHALRHATIFGALDSVASGGGMVLVAPHDPLPLLGQIEQRTPGRFAVDYLERGPEAWRLRFLRVAT